MRRDGPWRHQNKKMVEINGRFVTYKAMLSGLGVVLAIVVTIIVFSYQAINNRIDQRVSIELYQSETRRLCSDVDKIAKAVEENADKLTEVVVHQRLVLQKLGIPFSKR